MASAEDNMTPFNPASSGFGFAQIRQQRPDARIEVIADSGHYLVLEQPERVAELIVDFLS